MRNAKKLEKREGKIASKAAHAANKQQRAEVKQSCR